MAPHEISRAHALCNGLMLEGGRSPSSPPPTLVHPTHPLYCRFVERGLEVWNTTPTATMW